MGYTITKPEPKLLPVGLYAAIIVDAEAIEGRYGPEVQLTLELSKPQVQLRAWASATLSSRGKLYRWVEAILGTTPEQLDIDSLIGRSCRASIMWRIRPDGGKYNRVDEILAPREDDVQ